MKNILTLLIGVFLATSLCAQSPEKISFQAVIRNSDDNLVREQTVGMRISILQGSPDGITVYSETHSTSTNANGLISIEIGTGLTPYDFSTIDWANDIFFIKTETDPLGGSNFSITGISQLLSVPYALHAKTAVAVTGEITESDPIFNSSLLRNVTHEDTARWGTLLPIADSLNIITYDGNNWIAKDIIIATKNAGNETPVSIEQPYLVMRYCIALQGIFPSRNSSNPFIGEIQLFAFNFAPRNFANCDGQLLSISQNTALFSLLGTMYGGDGRTTFGLPDLRGRVPIHVGSGLGLTTKSMGQKSGAETVILPEHNHTITISFED